MKVGLGYGDVMKLAVAYANESVKFEKNTGQIGALADAHDALEKAVMRLEYLAFKQPPCRSSEWEWPGRISVPVCAKRVSQCPDCSHWVGIDPSTLALIDDDPEPLIRNEDWLPIEKTNFDFSVWRLWSPLVIREHYEPIGDEL